MIVGNWISCAIKGIAARIPICKLLAPRARANAARKPLVVMLKKPIESIPSMVIRRRPLATSCLVRLGLGLNIVVIAAMNLY
jgi:hypothetical protein